MEGREGSPSRQRRQTAIAACSLLLAGLLATGLVAATATFTSEAATPKRDVFPQDDTNTTGPVAGPMENESERPTDTAAENGTAAQSFAENDTSAPPAAAPPATDPQLVQGPDGNVTVAVAENQSVRAGDATPIALEVTNDGDRQATDVVVTVRTADGAVTFGPSTAPQTTRSIAIAELGSGDTETVDVEVAAARVDPGTYPLFASVQYRVDAESAADGADRDDADELNDDEEDKTVRTGGPTLLGIAVTESRSFDVTPVDDGIPVDSTGTYEVRIANEGEATVTGVVATVEAQPPLSSDSPTAYVGTLEPGDSKTARFALESSPDAVETTTSVTITLSHDTDTDGRTSAEPVPVPVTIVDDEDTDVDAAGPFAAVALVFVLAAIWWVRRR
ncbi:hypothetical protein A6E15_17755 [Natrinema saccharevitans]|uniref:DUF11 domain-containing protein n=1 Tax=Natrinema saccharevitans TaxID=301967 RepID=A0A1S8ART9_9EURY|nr:DUF11 domain-containing protein [Natrinema saccharevitans]OLZ39251.1 hypothetical protein A6E15_17755 [Natrinema saccharevitans]